MFDIKDTDFSIREFCVDDFQQLKKIAKAMNQKALQEDGYFPFYAFQIFPTTLDYDRCLDEKVNSFLCKAHQEQIQTPRSTYRLAVCDCQNRLIGNVTVDMLPIMEPDGRIVYGDLGYFIDPAKGKQGLMTKAVQRVLEIYFQTYSKLDITVHPDNVYSRRLIERFNGKQIGFLEKTVYQGEPRAMFVILKKDFFMATTNHCQITRQSSKTNIFTLLSRHVNERE